MAARRDKDSATDDPATEGAGDSQEALAFISETLTQLMAICERHRLDSIGYLLGMAHLETRETEHRLHRGGL